MFSLTSAPILMVLLSTMANAAATPDETYTNLRAAAVVDAITVEELVIKRDAGVLTLKTGTLGFTAPVMGRYTTAVFAGEGEFALAPGSAVEKSYLTSITGQETVVEAFDRALLCFTDQTGKELRGQSPPKPPDVRLNDILSDYRQRLRDRSDDPVSIWESILTSESMDNVEANILADLYNPAQPGFFSVYMHGRKHGDLRFHVNPRGVLPDLPATEEVAVINYDPGGDEEGVWYLGHLQSEVASGKALADEDKRVAQAVSYRIETNVAKNDRVSAVAELALRAVGAGERVIKFGLLPNLRVSKVTSGGQEIPFIQEGPKDDSSFHVIMPAPMERGSEHTLKIEYEGDKVLRKAGGGNYSVGARSSWYPSLNSFLDHAPYDLTFRVPQKFELVSVGRLKKKWTEQDLACSQWVSDVPLAVAGFNFGEFEKREAEDPDSGFAIEGYATKEVPDYLKMAESSVTGAMSPKALMNRTIIDALNSTRVFEAYFGKSVFGRVAVTQQSAFSYGQSWPSLIYLPLSAYLDSTQRWAVMGGISGSLSRFVEEVTPHEIAHQWWGHMVSPGTYHDAWISEGFATFSAGLYLQQAEKDKNKYLDYWKRSAERILKKNQYGKRPNDAGPISLGFRLNSAKNSDAYDAVVYEKGGYVLHMLRMMMYDAKEGDRIFKAMMQDFIQQNLNGNATTESFQRVAEKHMLPAMNLMGNGKLDWFFSQWVYGTAIPKYKFDSKVTQQADGKWLMEASLGQSEVPADFKGIVPIYADLDGEIVKLGSVRITGTRVMENLKIQLPKKPKRVLINAMRDVLEQ